MATIEEMIALGYKPKQNMGQNLADLATTILQARQNAESMSKQQAIDEGSLRESGYSMQPRKQGLAGFFSAPKYSYSAEDDLKRQLKMFESMKTAADIQKSQAEAKKAEFESTPEGRVRKLESSSSRLNAKDKKTAELFDTFETNAVKKQAVTDAREAVKNITGGLFGNLQRNFLGKFVPNAQQLTEWQKIKMVLTDAQLMQTAKTKGAISDREMELFADAAANDDMGSIAKMEPVFQRLMSALAADERSKVSAYKKMYGEDPMEWDEMQTFSTNKQETSQDLDPLGVLS